MKQTKNIFTAGFSNSGVSLVELLLVISLVGFLVVSVVNIPNSLGLIGQAQAASLAREIASSQIENIRSLQYANLADGSQSVIDPRLGQLPTGGGSIIITDCGTPICNSGENAKIVTVKIDWIQFGKPKEMQLVTLVSEGGLSK